MSIAGIFALGGGCYDDKRYHKKDRYYDKKDYRYDKKDYHYSSRNKCYDCDDDDDGLLGGLL